MHSIESIQMQSECKTRLPFPLYSDGSHARCSREDGRADCAFILAFIEYYYLTLITYSECLQPIDGFVRIKLYQCWDFHLKILTLTQMIHKLLLLFSLHGIFTWELEWLEHFQCIIRMLYLFTFDSNVGMCRVDEVEFPCTWSKKTVYINCP